MTNEIIKVLDYLGEKFGVAIDWTQQNVLPYIEDLAGRFIKYHTVEEIILVVIFALMGIVGFILVGILISSYSKANKTKSDRILMEYYNHGAEPSSFGTGVIIVTIICLLCGCIGVPICATELVKWIIIPEFQVVEEISYLMQTISGGTI